MDPVGNPGPVDAFPGDRVVAGNVRIIIGARPEVITGDDAETVGSVKLIAKSDCVIW